MTTCFANQRVLKIEKERILPSEHFAQLLDSSVNYAAKVLNGNAFKIWVYLMRSIDGRVFSFSPTDVYNNLGINTHSVKQAWKELEEKGFIVHNIKNEYTFIERPRMEVNGE